MHASYMDAVSCILYAYITRALDKRGIYLRGAGHEGGQRERLHGYYNTPRVHAVTRLERMLYTPARSWA